MFIAFDGIDASGKTTQVQILNDYLLTKGFKVNLYDMGKEGFLDEFFCELKLKRMVCSAEIRELLYYFEGVLFGKNVVAPLLKKVDCIGIVDRYLLSFYAYGPLNGISGEKIKLLTQSMPWPDLYFFVDTHPEQAINRIAKYRKINVPEIGYKNQLSDDEEQNREKFINFKNKVYNNFIYSITKANDNEKKIIIVDGNKGEDELADIVYKTVLNYILSFSEFQKGRQ